MSANQFPPLLASAGRSDATQSGLDDVDIPRFYDMLHGLLNLRCAVWCWRGFYNTLGELSHGADSGAAVIFVVLRGWIMQLSGSNSIGLEEALMSTSCHVTDSTPFESKLAIGRNCCVALSQPTRFCSLLQLEAQRLRLKLTQLATGKLAAKNFRPLRSRGEGIRTFHGLRLATCPHPILRRSR